MPLGSTLMPETYYTNHRNARAIAALRIAVGILFVIFSEYKVFGTQFTLHGGFQSYINRFLESGAYPFMAPVLRNFVLPHATAIAFVVAFGELVIGIALVLGFWTRAASLFALLFMLAMIFPSADPGPHAALWQYFGASLSQSVFALCFAAFLIGDPEEKWSLAGWRASRRAG